MANQQVLSTGIKINVDATDLDVKFAKSAEALNRTLTKSQKALGLFYNEQKQLVNSQGQVVEGLSQAQIKLGYYVDELGRTRTYQGGFVEGLNASQKAMGWFSDESGNVYNRLGELVIESQHATKSLNDLNDELANGSSVSSEYETALQDMADGADQALGSLSQLAGQTSQLFATIQAATGENDAFTSSIIAASQGVTTFIETYGAVVGVMQYMDALRRATIAQEWATVAATVAQKGLNAAMKANPIGLIVGGVAALTAAVATYKSTVKDAAAETSGSFAEIEAAARRAGEAIKSAADIAKYGLRGPETYAGIADEYDKLAQEKASAQKIVDAENQRRAVIAAAGGQRGFTIDLFTDASEKAFNEAEATIKAVDERQKIVGEELAEMQARLLAKARESVQTESQKLEAERRNYEALLANAKGTEESATINAYIKQLDKKIAAAKENELAALRKPISEADYTLDSGALAQAVANGRYTIEEAQAAYQGALDRQAKALDDMKIPEILESLKTVKTPLQQLDDVATRLNAAYQNGIVSQSKYNEAIAGIAQKRSELETLEAQAAQREANERNAEIRSKYGVDEALKSIEMEILAQKTPLELMNDAIAGYQEAMKQGAIDVVTFNKLSENERQKYLKATQEATDAVERERRDKIAALRNESGIDSFLESLKTPWEKYLDNLDKINGYVAQGAVTAAEAQLLAGKALEDVSATMKENDKRESNFTAVKSKSVEAATAGSAELYKMQLSQQNDKTAQMLDAQRQILQSSQTMALYLFEMQRNIAAMAANWPKVYGR